MPGRSVSTLSYLLGALILFHIPLLSFAATPGVFDPPHVLVISAAALLVIALLLGAYGVFLHRKLCLLTKSGGQQWGTRCVESHVCSRDSVPHMLNSIERLQRFAQLSSEWYWEQDAGLRFTMRSKWRLGDQDIAVEQFIGKQRWDLDNPHSELFWNGHKNTLQARLPFQDFQYQYCHEGQTYWISVSGEPIFAADSSFQGYRGTARDITKQKEVEEALRFSEERFEEIVNLMPVSVFVKDPHSRVIFMNTESEKQWGVRLKEVRGTDLSTIFPPEQVASYLAMDRKAFSDRNVIDYEETIWNASLAENRNVRTFKKPVYDELGCPRYLIGIRIDTTEKRLVEEQLRKSEESIRDLALHQAGLIEEERKRIARDIHDELGQNLMALRIETSRLVQRASERHPRLRTSAAAMLNTIDETIRSVRQIINNLRPAVLDLGLPAVLEWQVRQFEKHGSLRCTLDISVDENSLQLDNEFATAIFRILQESLTNVQRHANASTVHVSLRCDNGSLSLSIADNGIGYVPSGDKAMGFGILGMSERVKRLGGTLHIEGVPNHGTMFKVSFPLPIQYATSAAETKLVPLLTASGQ